jgi:NAD(P)-dependent dehydrogenase (short-subunit alcohol dehydrogenase family)
LQSSPAPAKASVRASLVYSPRPAPKIVIATRSQANGHAVADAIVKGGGTAWLNQTDVGHRAEVKRVVAQTVERFGRLDIVVHNAGVYPISSIEQLSDDDLDLTLSVNLKASSGSFRNRSRTCENRAVVFSSPPPLPAQMSRCRAPRITRLRSAASTD